MELSLVVATRNRAHRLPAFFDTVGELRSRHEWELVMVDNGSTDDSPSVIQAFRERAGVPVRAVHEPRPGLGRALNAGVRAARGRIIATTDDDCYPEPDYLDLVRRTFDRHDVGFMGGRVRLFDESAVPISILDREDPALLPSPAFPYPGFITGANLAFRREVFDDIGGFDEAFGAGTPFPCEDVDFCARASASGWHGGYFPGPTVHHDHGRESDRDVKRLRVAYARGRGAFYARTLLDLAPLRLPCLKWWYWSLDSTPSRLTFREVGSALRYLGRRLRLKLLPASSRPTVGVGNGRRRRAE